MTLPLLLVVAAYVLGATPTSLWVGRAVFGVDLRREGSGNLGATNVFRVLGWKPALPVVLADVAKGWIPVALFPLATPGVAPGWLLAWGGAAIIGHVFSFWAGFRGGKGIATSAGVFIALAPWAALAGFVVWLLVVLTTRYVSLGSLLAALILPVAVAVTPHQGGAATLWFTLVLATFVIWAHRANIRRLLRGEENRFGRTEATAP
jgi:acyl phosphate:glycerol-3-phosphate acyltransferase